MNQTTRHAAVVAAAVAALAGAATAGAAGPAGSDGKDGISVVAHTGMLSAPVDAPAEGDLAVVQHVAL
ncbi:hypothetical protein ACFY7H_14040 [Streptomyces sp. NPDC012794]|uniref:hypothetical protein n=1 Tax=Streptomyces sp. NPDC012794 TaxID=3364850 RepID=UPI0036AB459E